MILLSSKSVNATLIGAASLSLAFSSSRAIAQQDVRVGIRGYVDEKINIAIDDMSPASSAAQTLSEVLAFDLEYSLRFNVISGQAQAGIVRSSSGVDYEAWAVFGTQYLVRGSLTPVGAGFQGELEIHNVPFQRQTQTLSFALPTGDSPNFRMAMHEVSNAIIHSRSSPSSRNSEAVSAYSGSDFSFFL